MSRFAVGLIGGTTIGVLLLIGMTQAPAESTSGRAALTPASTARDSMSRLASVETPASQLPKAAEPIVEIGGDASSDQSPLAVFGNWLDEQHARYERQMRAAEAVMLSRLEPEPELTPEAVDCTVCDNSKWLDCGDCSGSGSIRGCVDCARCKEGTIRCPACRTRGWISCSACGGDGSVIAWVGRDDATSAPRRVTRSCSRCSGGRKQCRGCDGRGLASCRTCKGSGERCNAILDCKSCDGKKHRRCLACRS